jgi:hypothetical protein
MNRLTPVRSRPSAITPMVCWGSAFPIVARLWRELFNELARFASPASRDGDAVPLRVRNPHSNLPLSHPASLLPPLPGSHAAGPVPPAGRTYSSRLASDCAATYPFPGLVVGKYLNFNTLNC